MTKTPRALLAIVVAVLATVDARPLGAQLLPLPLKTRARPTPTVTALPQTLPTPTATRTATPSPTATAAVLPDLVPEISDVYLSLGTTAESGDVAEGCAEATTGVDLLRFSAASKNVGTGDLVLGDPGCPSPCVDHPLEVCANPDFVCSPAAGHNHAHYDNYARYELLDQSGEAVVVGHKQGFCLRDTNCAAPVYTCANQGVSAGCFDLYAYWLGCQYLDVTGIPAGNYRLRVTIDPSNKFAELSESNNVAEQAVVIARPGVATPTPTRTATPQQTITVAKTATPVVPVATATVTAVATIVPSVTPTATVVPTVTVTPGPLDPPTPTASAGPPSPTPTSTGVTPNGALASACQRAFLKAGRTLVSRTIAGLDDCVGAVSSCDPPSRRTAGCQERATTSCARGLEKIAAAREAFTARVGARCTGVGDAELLGPAGLDFARRSTACTALGAGGGDLASIAECVIRQHLCRSGTVQEVEDPRVGARLRRGGALGPGLCIADLGGGDPAASDLADARDLEACSRGLRRAGRRFALHRLSHLQSCLAAHAACLKAGDNRASCEQRAAATCQARVARLAGDGARLAATIDRSCAALDFATLLAEPRGNLGALAATCAELGVPTLQSLADYQQCLVRQHACAVDDLLRFQAPRADTWIGAWPAPGDPCPAAD